ncbi:MAG: glycosyltransferase [Patescibacteria group bacterium]|jgi:glycosyltransferase involved in cell wall biosynthesis
MKIILGTESFSPNISGVAVATEILANNLLKSGHEPIVLCPSRTGETSVDKSFPYKVIRLKSIVNPFRKGFRITSASKNEIRRQIESIQPDLIHLQDVATIGIMLRDVGNEKNIPVVITNHFSLEFAIAYVKLKILKPFSKFLLTRYLVSFHNRCDLVLTPTETIAKQIRSWGVKTPVVAISNGIFYDRFARKFPQKKINDFKIKYHLPNNPIVLYTGRIDQDKSIDVIVRAIPDVVKDTTAHFVFAGTGDLISEMEKLAEDLSVRKDLTMLGRLDHDSDDFVALYKSATVFAIASTIETQSLVTLEAMSAGLPIVAVKANALPELVKDEVNGFLFKTDDSKDLAKGLVEIIRHKRQAEVMGRHSMQIASQHEITKTFHELLDIYRELIESKQKRGSASV